MNQRKSLVAVLSFVAVTVASSIFAAQTSERFHPFGMVGLVPGQTARINVVLVENGDPNQRGSMNPGLWVETFFINGDGRVISRSAPRALWVGIAYGHELPACPSDTGAAGGECAAPTAVERRAQIRAFVRVFGDGVKRIGTDFNVLSTVEVFDGDGKTQVLQLPSAQ